MSESAKRGIQEAVRAAQEAQTRAVTRYTYDGTLEGRKRVDELTVRDMVEAAIPIIDRMRTQQYRAYIDAMYDACRELLSDKRDHTLIGPLEDYFDHVLGTTGFGYQVEGFEDILAEREELRKDVTRLKNELVNLAADNAGLRVGLSSALGYLSHDADEGDEQARRIIDEIGYVL